MDSLPAGRFVTSAGGCEPTQRVSLNHRFVVTEWQLGRGASALSRVGRAFRSARKSQTPDLVTCALFRDHPGGRDPLASFRVSGVSPPVREGGYGLDLLHRGPKVVFGGVPSTCRCRGHTRDRLREAEDRPKRDLSSINQLTSKRIKLPSLRMLAQHNEALNDEREHPP